MRHLPDLAAAPAAGLPAGKAKSTILFFLCGGASHIDMWDLKPEAPSEIRGPFKPISTVVPGTQIGEILPLCAKVVDKFTILRSHSHADNAHQTGRHWVMTGYPPNFPDGQARGVPFNELYPSLGSIVARELGERGSVPPYIEVPEPMGPGGPGFYGAKYAPFTINNDPAQPDFEVRDLNVPESVAEDRFARRRRLLERAEALGESAKATGKAKTMASYYEKAVDLVTSPEARKAFDISQEDPKTRDLYGRTHWGQCTLLARRLVEAGSTFVTVHYGGWDHHWNLQSGYESLLPQVDAAVAGLFTDLAQRGLDKKVLVMLCGEFSRTPRMNDGGNGGPPGSQGTPGRDHWGNAMFCLMGGGGVKGGQIVGSTNRLGEAPLDRPLTPGDIHATMFHCLGVDPHVAFTDHSGRPVTAVEHGEVIRELV